MTARVVRADGRDPRFLALVRRLDAELQARYGELQAAYDVHNAFVPEHAVIALDAAGAPVGCGCLKPFDLAPATAELKRMYVAAEARRGGVGRALVAALEAWARELGHAAMVLETGARQPDALGLYEACGYARIERYGPYVGLELSVCMRKRLVDRVEPRR